MPANPHQRKEISIEKLKILRKNVREAYKKSTGEILPTAKNKSNPFYIGLIDDISEKTKEKQEISQGTIQKFLYDDGNRNYQIFIIQMIEKYINTVGNVVVEETENNIIESKVSELKIDPEIKILAHRIYIELITRKAAIAIDTENDVIEEIYNSWYKLFCIIRDEMKTLPIRYFNDKESQPVIILSMKILNEALRPHLTEHQAKYRAWLEKAKNNLKYKNLIPQELQKNYPDYNNLVQSMKTTNLILMDCSKSLQFS